MGGAHCEMGAGFSELSPRWGQFSAVVEGKFCVYGGRTKDFLQLDTRTWTWKQLSSTGPMRKVGCGMVAHGSNLVLFGGYGIPSGPTQPGAEFELT